MIHSDCISEVQDLLSDFINQLSKHCVSVTAFSSFSGNIPRYTNKPSDTSTVTIVTVQGFFPLHPDLVVLVLFSFGGFVHFIPEEKV